MTQENADKPTLERYLSLYGPAALAIGIGVFIWWIRSDPRVAPTLPTQTLREGATIDAAITLVSADKHDLACAMEGQIDGAHCEYAAPDKKWIDAHPQADASDRKHLLSPYMTVDNVLFLIPGLFEDPAVDERYVDEPPAGIARDKLQRFNAQCKLHLIRQANEVQVRWQPKMQWQAKADNVWVGTVSNCQTTEP